MAEDFAALVAGRIRELRQARGMSLRELSRRSGVAPESVSRSERGLNEITITNLSRLSKGLGLSLRDFFDFDRMPDFLVADQRDDISRVAAILKTAKPADRRKMVAVLEVLSKPSSP